MMTMGSAACMYLIAEGVYKSLQSTQAHFAALYDNAPCRYFIYNSAKLSDVRQFAYSANIEIMIINIDAFRKAENVINQQHDRLNGDAAIRYMFSGSLFHFYFVHQFRP